MSVRRESLQSRSVVYTPNDVTPSDDDTLPSFADGIGQVRLDRTAKNVAVISEDGVHVYTAARDKWIQSIPTLELKSVIGMQILGLYTT